MAVRIERHYARSEPETRFRFITIYWDGGFRVLPERLFANPTEFQIAVELLRREDEVYWDEESCRLLTRHDRAGAGLAPWMGVPASVRCQPGEATEEELAQIAGFEQRPAAAGARTNRPARRKRRA